jgi:hypothetical protein
VPFVHLTGNLKHAFSHSDMLLTHAVPDDPENEKELARAQIAGPAFFLLRPDGHIGLAGARLEPDVLPGYLADHHFRFDRKTPNIAGSPLRAT